MDRAALAVSVAQADDGSRGQSLALLRSTADGVALWSAELLDETDQPAPLQRIDTALPDGVIAALGLHHNADPQSAGARWTVLAGRDGLWWRTQPEAPLTYLAFAADTLGMPLALVSRGRLMTVCAALVTAPEVTLSVARIAADARLPVQPARVHAFAEPPQAIAAAIGRVDAGSPIIVAALTALPGNTLLTVLRIDGSGNGRLRVERSGAFTLPAVQPVGGVSVIVAGDGRIEVVALLRETPATAHEREPRPPCYSRAVWTLRPDLEMESAQLSSSFRLPALQGGNAVIDVQHGQRLHADGRVATITVLRHCGTDVPLVLRDDGPPGEARIALPAPMPYALASRRQGWQALWHADGVLAAGPL